MRLGRVRPSGIAPEVSPRAELDASLFSRLFFRWLVPLIRRGYAQPLQPVDLPPLISLDQSSVCAPVFNFAYRHVAAADLRRTNPSARENDLINKLCSEGGSRCQAANSRTSPPLSFILRAATLLPSRLAAKTSRALLPLTAGPFLKAAVWKPFWVGAAAAQAFCIRAIVERVTLEAGGSQLDSSRWIYVPIVFAMAAAALLMSLAQHWTFAFSMRAGMRARAALSREIYRKLLRLSPTSASKVSEGELGNLLLNDTQRMLDSYTYFHFCAFGFFEIIVLSGLLTIDLGLAAFFGVGILLLLVPVQISFSSVICRARLKVSKEADARVTKMNEVLSGIRTVKMSAWEPHFTSVITDLRSRELRDLRISAVVRALNSAVFFSAPVLVALATFASRTLLVGEPLTPATVFSSLTYFYKLANVLNLMPVGWLAASEASVSSRRLDSFFDLPEVGFALASDRLDVAEIMSHHADLHRDVNGNGSSQPDVYPPGASQSCVSERPNHLGGSEGEKMHSCERLWLHRAHFAYAVTGKDEGGESASALENVSLSVRDGDLLTVVGPVGSGKSSLLLGILGELECTTGEVKKRGRVAYCAQQPWIINATVRDNIVMFGAGHEEFHESWYRAVVKACCLVSDLHSLPAGDMTEIGERGINLSGGQRARVALARAVYSKADLYLFDDPLSAVDAKVSAALVRRIFGRNGLLARKAKIVVTHQLNLLPISSSVAVLRRGCVSQIGTFEELRTRGVEFHGLACREELRMVKSSNESASKFNEGLPGHCMKESEVVSQAGLEEALSKPFDLGMSSDSGIGNGTLATLSDDSSDSNERQAHRNQTSSVKSISGGNVANGIAGNKQDHLDTAGDLIVQEDRRIGRVNFGIYRSYLDAAGGFAALFFVGFAFLCAQVVRQLADWWLSRWSTISLRLDEQMEGKLFEENRFHALVFFGLAMGTLIFSLLRACLYAQRTMCASKRLHDSLLDRVLHAKPSFFDTNPLGRILNRFSKDVDQMDNLLPTTSQECLQIAFVVLGALATISVILPWFLLVLLPVGVAFVGLQRLYKMSSRELKRIDGTTRSPIYAQFLETSVGLATVRAFGAETSFTSVFSSRVDHNHCAYHMFVCAGRWLGIHLDLLSMVIIFVTALVVVIVSPSLNAGLAGVALTQSILMTGAFQWGVRQAAETENIFTSVERISNMATNTPIENPHHVPGKKPPTDWPAEGRLSFQDVSLKYRPDLDPALRNVSFETLARERIGIVGRTGSGKSSLFVALFRMVELAEGSVILDGVNVGHIGLHDLRSKISIVPQDPVLFRGSIRSNLDPTGIYNDTQLWDVLHRVQLSSVIDGTGGKREGYETGLDLGVDEKGGNFSVGQRQLLALARAILSGNRVVVLDEASASLDNHTDMLVQKTVREQLGDRTVLTIAHRLATIVDSDRILVMESGQVAEFDSPRALLSNGGYFARLLEETGSIESAILRRTIMQSSEME